MFLDRLAHDLGGIGYRHRNASFLLRRYLTSVSPWLQFATMPQLTFRMQFARRRAGVMVARASLALIGNPDANFAIGLPLKRSRPNASKDAGDDGAPPGHVELPRPWLVAFASLGVGSQAAFTAPRALRSLSSWCLESDVLRTRGLNGSISGRTLSGVERLISMN